MISEKQVNKLFEKCLFKNEEIIKGKLIIEPVYVKGLILNFGFHPERIKKFKKEIETIINQLTEALYKGCSFFDLRITKDGKLWTDTYYICEELMVLGIAAKKMQYIENKHTLYKGIPYIQII